MCGGLGLVDARRATRGCTPTISTITSLVPWSPLAAHDAKAKAAHIAASGK